TLLFESQELSHIPVVFFMASLGAEIKPEFVDHLDTVVSKPIVPAIRTDGCMNSLANFVAYGRSRKLAGETSGHTSRPLTLEAGTAFSLRLLELRNRLPEFAEHFGHLVSRNVVAALVRNGEAFCENLARLVVSSDLGQTGPK